MPETPLTSTPPQFTTRVDPPGMPPPKVLENRPDGRGNVRVTFALPGLRRGVVTVPEGRWVAGAHVQLGRHLAAISAEIDRQVSAEWTMLQEQH